MSNMVFKERILTIPMWHLSLLSNIAFPSPIKFSFHQAFGHEVLKVSKPIVSNRTVSSISEKSSHNLFPTKSTMWGITEELTATQK